MGKSSKVAISLPEDILEAVERERKARGESRSKFLQRAVVSHLKRERESSAVEEYIRGYQEIPEYSEDVEAAHRLGSAILGGEPWE